VSELSERSPTVADVTDEEVEAAAKVLFAAGALHQWWPPSCTSYEALDPIGREEFDAIVADILIAAARARTA
jgi:hypothetical protein